MQDVERSEPAETKYGWLDWLLMNGFLLSVVGIAIFVLSLEFGSQGYTYILPGGIAICVLVGVTHWYFLSKQAAARLWITVTFAAWMVTLLFTSALFSDMADLLPNAGQVATGGVIFFYLCPCSAAIGPVVALVGAMILKSAK